MRSSLRQALITATAVIGLGSLAAYAAAPMAGGAAAPTPPAKVGDLATPKAEFSPGHNMAARVERRLTSLHAKLQITAAQAPQWNAFALVMRDNAQRMDKAFLGRIQAMPTMSAAQNMQSYADVAKEHARDMEKLAPTFLALYNTMSSSQKATADQMFRNQAALHPGRTVKPG